MPLPTYDHKSPTSVWMTTHPLHPSPLQDPEGANPFPSEFCAVKLIPAPPTPPPQLPTDETPSIVQPPEEGPEKSPLAHEPGLDADA